MRGRGRLTKVIACMEAEERRRARKEEIQARLTVARREYRNAYANIVRVLGAIREITPTLEPAETLLPFSLDDSETGVDTDLESMIGVASMHDRHLNKSVADVIDGIRDWECRVGQIAHLDTIVRALMHDDPRATNSVMVKICAASGAFDDDDEK